MNEQWNDLEKEDYQFYLDHINKFTSPKHSFDIYNILDQGHIPKEFINNAEMLQCAYEVAYFVRVNDIRFANRPEYFANLEKLMEKLDKPHIIFMLKQFTLVQLESCMLASKKLGKLDTWKDIIQLMSDIL